MLTKSGDESAKKLLAELEGKSEVVLFSNQADSLSCWTFCLIYQLVRTNESNA
jgi:hypothetical protein